MLAILITTCLLLHSMYTSFFYAVSLSFGTNYFYRPLSSYAGLSSPPFICLLVHIRSSSRLAHATAPLESGFCALGVHVFYQCDITFRFPVACTVLQLLHFRYIVLWILQSTHVVPQSSRFLATPPSQEERSNNDDNFCSVLVRSSENIQFFFKYVFCWNTCLTSPRSR